MFPKPHFVNTNGIRLALYEQGQGPPVVFLHGFPELAFSWRFQLPAIAEAGFRAIAADQRGYGRSSVPPNVEDYGIDCLIGDVLGLLDTLGLERATFVGHDWGAFVLWHMSLLCPERMDRQAILNIPFWPRPPIDPIALFRQQLGDDFYIVNFQDSNEADRAFAKTGFTGPINWYRNWTANWERLEGVPQIVEVPTLFIGALDDIVVSPEHIEAMKPFVTDLECHVLDNCGHWSQQERADDVNRLLIDWLDS